MHNYRADHAGVGELLRGPEMRSLIRDRGGAAAKLYAATVTRRTGRLARSPQVVMRENAGPKRDRWIAHVIAQAEVAPHAAIHEFDRDSVSGRFTAGAHDWPVVLSQLGSR